MDIGLIITIITTGIAVAAAVIGTNVALFSWLRADMKTFESEIRGWKDAIDKEMKDFHSKLCVLDERTKKL